MRKKIGLRNKKQKRSGKKKAAYFFASFFTTLALLLSIGGFIIVDRHSRYIGWSEKSASLAMSPQNGKINLTVLGKKIEVDSAPVAETEKTFRQLKKGYAIIEPPTLRFVNEFQYVSRPVVKKIISKAASLFNFS